MLLVITNKTDLTSDYLAIRLKERSIPFFRLNTEDYPDLIDIDFKFSVKKQNIIIKYLCKQLNLSDVTAAYFRRPVLPYINNIDIADTDFAQRELETTIAGLCRLIKEEIWLNQPKNIYFANNKIEQLKMSLELGFNIPNTLISKNFEEIKNFYFVNKPIIGKAVKNGFYSTDDRSVKIALTQNITADDMDRIEEFAPVPMIYQNKLRKKYDIRVTVVGDNVFPVAIMSQEYEECETDWRAWDILNKLDLKHEVLILPSDVSQKCIDLTRRFKLKFSTIDLVFTQEDEYVFLELNPNGQWAWIEEKTRLPIRDAIIDTLYKRG